MTTEFVHVGYGGTVAVNRVLAIASPDSAPIKRMVRQATKDGRVINLTYGRKAKAVLVMDSGHVALAAFQPAVILRRIQDRRTPGGAALEQNDDAEHGDMAMREDPSEPAR